MNTMKNHYKTQITADKFFESQSGQDNYDAEIARLNENRIRFAQWKKEEAKRAVLKNKHKNDFL